MVLFPWPVARPPGRSNRRSRLVGATKPSGWQNLRSRLMGSKKIPTPRHLQHSTFHRSSSLGCATVLQSKPITAFSNDESHYHPKPTSHDKKKRSHASKPAHTQWHDKTKQKRQPKPKQDTTLKEREVHLSYADVSQEEWANQIKFALHHKSRVKAACELPEESRPQPLKVANEARLKEAILALTNLSPEIPSQGQACHSSRLCRSRPGSSRRSHYDSKGSAAGVHGTSAIAAQCILLEGFIRPVDWTYHSDYRYCQFPMLGAYAMGMEVSRSEETVPA